MLLCVIDTSSSNPVASAGSAAEPWDLSLWCPGHLEPFSGSPGCFCPGLGAISCLGAQLHIRQPWHTTSSLPAGKTQAAGFWALLNFLPCLVPSCFALLQRSLESQMVPKGGGHPWPVWWLCRSQGSAAAGHTGLSKLIAQQSLGRGYHCPEVVLEGDQLEPS